MLLISIIIIYDQIYLSVYLLNETQIRQLRNVTSMEWSYYNKLIIIRPLH